MGVLSFDKDYTISTGVKRREKDQSGLITGINKSHDHSSPKFFLLYSMGAGMMALQSMITGVISIAAAHPSYFKNLHSLTSNHTSLKLQFMR